MRNNKNNMPCYKSSVWGNVPESIWFIVWKKSLKKYLTHIKKNNNSSNNNSMVRTLSAIPYNSILSRLSHVNINSVSSFCSFCTHPLTTIKNYLHVVKLYYHWICFFFTCAHLHFVHSFVLRSLKFYLKYFKWANNTIRFVFDEFIYSV